MTHLLPARRTLASVALAPLLVTGLASCGDDAADTTARDDTQVAAFGGLEKGDEVDATEFVDTVADGVEKSTTAHVTVEVALGDEVATSGDGEIDYTTTPPSMKMTMSTAGAGDAEVLMVDGLMYLQAGALSNGTYWKIDPADPDGMLAGMGMDTMLDQADPIGSLKGVRSGIDSVTFEGTEDVDGRDLSRYELTVDLRSVLEATGSALPAAAAKGLPESVTYDVWLDEEGRFSQLSMAYPILGKEVSTEMTATDWGTEVDIAAPPADEVTDMPSMQEMLKGLDQTPAA